MDAIDAAARAHHSAYTTPVTVLPVVGADTTLPPSTVTRTNPAKGAIVTTSPVVVTLTVNPATQPLTIPPPHAHEYYADYVARLQGLGWLGNATRVDLDAAHEDPKRGEAETVPGKSMWWSELPSHWRGAKSALSPAAASARRTTSPRRRLSV